MTTTHGTWRNYALPLALIVAGGLVLRYLHFSLALGSDDEVWIKVAREISASAPHSDYPVYYTRLVWTWLLILWGLLGSLTLEWSSVLMFVLSGLTTLFIAMAARIAFGVRGALLAALVYAAHPLAVTFDTATLPDGLAVCLLAALSALFMRYLRDRRVPRLIVPGLLIGLLFGVKNYFMLVSLPCAILILGQPGSWRRRVTDLGVLAAAATGGLAVPLLLGLAANVDAAAHLSGAHQYVDYISQGLSSGRSPMGMRALLTLLAERSEAFFLLFFGFGAVLGCLTLFGLAWSLAHWRSPAQRFVATTALLFLGFLMLMPVRLSPLLFTQLHDRYLTVVLPALAIATGAGLAELWSSLSDRALRAAAACTLAVVVGFSAWVPNDLHDRYRTLEIRGLAQALDEAVARGTKELIVPIEYRRLVPRSYLERGVRLRFLDLTAPAEAATAMNAVAMDPGSSMLVFRMPYRTIAQKLRTGDYREETGFGGAVASLMDEARHDGYAIEEVRVPYDTARVWLARLGIPTRGQLVGWLVTRPAK